MTRIIKANTFQWVKQHDSMQCGVSCLAMICTHYGRNYSVEYLGRFCHANVAGVSMLGITDGAKSMGFNVMTVAASIAELNKNLLPCILHWNQNHFVVLYKIKKSEVRNIFMSQIPQKDVLYTLLKNSKSIGQLPSLKKRHKE